jgi:hypothetical protein
MYEVRQPALDFDSSISGAGQARVKANGTVMYVPAINEHKANDEYNSRKEYISKTSIL